MVMSFLGESTFDGGRARVQRWTGALQSKYTIGAHGSTGQKRSSEDVKHWSADDPSHLLGRALLVPHRRGSRCPP